MEPRSIREQDMGAKQTADCDEQVAQGVDPMPLNGNPHPLPGQLVHHNLQFALPPYPALGWNAVPLAPGDPGPAAADADVGGWG